MRQKDCYIYIIVTFLPDTYNIYKCSLKEHHSLSSILVVPPSPFDLNVTQLSLTSVRVSWSQEEDDVDIDSYIIYYQLVTGGSEMVLQTGSNDTFRIIRGLVQGGMYSFSVASSNYIVNSARTDPLNISLGMLYYIKQTCIVIVYT